MVGWVFGGEFLDDLEADADVGTADEDDGFFGGSLGAHCYEGDVGRIWKGALTGISTTQNKNALE